MSLAKTNSDFAQRSFLKRASFAVIAATALLAGCADGSGFKPLYGTSAIGGADVNDKLATVDIAPIPGRVGQRLRNEFIFQSTGGGDAKPTKYRLEVAVRESVSSTLVKIDGNARGQIYNLDAAFKLVRVTDSAIVLEGKSYGRAGFERVTSVFANVRAREDAENRAAKTVGEELRTRLLAYLASPA